MSSSDDTLPAIACLYKKKRDLLVRVVREGLRRLDTDLEAVIEHAGTLEKLRHWAALPADLEACAESVRSTDVKEGMHQLSQLRVAAEQAVRDWAAHHDGNTVAGIQRVLSHGARIDALIWASYGDIEEHLGLLGGPRDDLVRYINGSANPVLALDGAASEGERLRRERAAHVSRLGQKLALDDREYAVALTESLLGCHSGGNDDSIEDVCDARIAAWYEAELDFIDSERSCQQTFLSRALRSVNTEHADRTSPRRSPRRAARTLLDAYEGFEAVSVAITEGKAHYEAVMGFLCREPGADVAGTR